MNLLMVSSLWQKCAGLAKRTKIAFGEIKRAAYIQITADICVHDLPKVTFRIPFPSFRAWPELSDRALFLSGAQPCATGLSPIPITRPVAGPLTKDV